MEVKNREFSGKIRILMVDNDSTCVLITAVSLKKSNFEVTTVKSAKDALAILRSSILSFDLVVTEVHMAEMDGFQLQQEIARESNIPVIFFSVDDKESTAMKGLQSGVIFFIVKPMSQDDIHHLWEYVTLIKRKKEVVNQKTTNEKIPHEAIYIESSSSDDERDKSARKYDETENEESSSPPSKKIRIVWTVARHDKFLEALTKLGLEKAHPREILKLMNTPELTRIHVASHLQKYRKSLQKDTCSGLVSNSSKTKFGNANQLSTTKAIDNISTSAQQVMIKNLNSASYDTQVDHQNFQNDRRDKEFADILYHHINQKPLHTGFGEDSVSLLPESLENTKEGGSGTKSDGFSMLDNVYAIPHSTKVTTATFESQLNIQSSNPQGDYENFTAEECLFLQNILLNKEHEQKNYVGNIEEERPLHRHKFLSNSEPEKEKYGGIAADASSSHPNNIPSNSKSQQEDYGCFTAEDYSFLHNILNQELEHKNYGDATTEKGSFQLHNDHPNSKFEKKIHDDITVDESSFHLHNIFPDSEPQQENYGDDTKKETSFQYHYILSKLEQEDYGNFTAEECSYLRNIFLNQEHEEGNNEDVTIEQGSFQLHYDYLNSKFEV